MGNRDVRSRLPKFELGVMSEFIDWCCTKHRYNGRAISSSTSFPDSHQKFALGRRQLRSWVCQAAKSRLVTSPLHIILVVLIPQLSSLTLGVAVVVTDDTRLCRTKFL